jgi:hypothetical protein
MVPVVLPDPVFSRDVRKGFEIAIGRQDGQAVLPGEGYEHDIHLGQDATLAPQFEITRTVEP